MNFINNPFIREAAIDKKKNFLLTKGLTEDEINLAFELCVSRPSNDVGLKRELDLFGSLYPGATLSSSNTLSRILKLIYLVTLWGCFSYGAYAFYKKNLRPLFVKSCKQKTAEQEICDQIQSLNDQIVELSKNIIIVQEFVRTYCRGRDDNLLQLKNELNTIKSLLVNKNQFPLAPSIPKWQLDSTRNTQKNLSSNAVCVPTDSNE